MGCSTIPFQQAPEVPVDQVDPGMARTAFARSLPESFQLVNTIIFQYRGRNIAAMGYTRVDTVHKTFSVTGLHPVSGFTLFRLAGDRDTEKAQYLAAAFAQWEDFPRAVADAIRWIYFDRVPEPHAGVRKERMRIRFKSVSAAGNTEYIFAGAGPLLTEKRFSVGNRNIWTVRYYEYQRDQGKLYPAGIILNHRQHGYQLVLRLKEIRR